MVDKWTLYCCCCYYYNIFIMSVVVVAEGHLTCREVGFPCTHQALTSFLVHPDKWLSNRGNSPSYSLASPPPPHRAFGQVWRHFWSLQLRGGCYWHLVGGSWDATQHSSVHRLAPHNRVTCLQMRNLVLGVFLKLRVVTY